MDVLNAPVTKVDYTETDSLLVVGFEQADYYALNKYKNGSGKYHLKRINSSFQAYHWLVDQSKNELPERQVKGILCDLAFLKADNYRLLSKINSDPNFAHLPFITISTDHTFIEPQSALLMGIDDCYYIQNLNWKDIQRRVEFLSRFKSQIMNTSFSRDFVPYKIPIGKRIFDITFASAVLLFISPILLLIAIAVRLESKGSIFYTSKRAGTGFQIFDFIKFRSMYHDADKRLKEIEHLNQYSEEEEGGAPSFKKFANDPRVTRVGKIIRKTSLDELPQLINVLKGDMSIVGNRPLPLYEADMLTNDEWATRFIAPAGLTGLWQISKRGKKDMSSQERIQLDIDYAKKYSIWMDLSILMKTLPAMIQDEQV